MNASQIRIGAEVRLALIGYNPKSLTIADLTALQAADGRTGRRIGNQ
jgi:hypothetical protein